MSPPRRAVDLEAAVLALLAERGAHATVCPSEVARRMSPGGWRALMPGVRDAARSLARTGRIELRQRGERISPDQEPHGPIRLALARDARERG